MKNNGANLNESTISKKLEVVNSYLKKDNLADADRLNAELIALDLKESLKEIEVMESRQEYKGETDKFASCMLIMVTIFFLYWVRTVLFALSNA